MEAIGVAIGFDTLHNHSIFIFEIRGSIITVMVDDS